MANEHVNKVVLGDEVLLDLTGDTSVAADVAAGKTLHLATGAPATGTASYASAPTNFGNADKANAILYGAVDSTSTSTAFTATVEGLDALTDGTCIMLHNGVVTSAAGFTVNVNNLGAKKCYNNLTNATQESTIFNIAYTLMLVYAEALDEGNGGWWIYRGYDSNTNTIGYQLRTNSGNKTASDTGYRYRLWFTSADGSKWVPANTSTSTNATSNRTLNTRAIDPFGPIVYRATNGTCNSGAGIGATGIWQQYTLTIGYSYMASGFSLTFPDSVYLRCTPQSDGSAVMQDIVQALPSSNDGKIYIHLGTAYSATNMELQTEHPVYYHDGTGIRIWTGSEYQAKLVSGTNIKTVGSQSLLGSGNLTVANIGAAAASHAHGSITDAGAITSDTTVASGDKLIIADSSASSVLKRSGIAFGTDTTTFLRNDGQWAEAGGGGGGASYLTTPATLPTSGWTSDSITVNVAGVAADSAVIVSPAPASAAEWASCGILCTAQGAGTLTFTRTSANSNALTANVMVWAGGVMVLFGMSGTFDSNGSISAPTSWVPTDGVRYSVHAEITGSLSGTYDGQAEGFVNGDNIWLYFYDSTQSGLITDSFVSFGNGTASYTSRYPVGGCGFELTVYG